MVKLPCAVRGVGAIDDNPDINKYMGYYQSKLSPVRRCGAERRDSTTEYWLRRRGSRPELSGEQACAPYTQVCCGYGESLIDYNFNQTRVGVGVCAE
jgi:phospholipase A1